MVAVEDAGHGINESVSEWGQKRKKKKTKKYANFIRSPFPFAL